MKLFATLLRIYEMMGSHVSHGLSERKQLIQRGACSAGETVYSVHIKYNFSKSNKMYRLSLYLQDFPHYCLGLSPSALF